MTHCCGWWGQLVHGSNCAKKRLLLYFTDSTICTLLRNHNICSAAAENFNCSRLPICFLPFCHRLGINSRLCKLQNCVSGRVCRGEDVGAATCSRSSLFYIPLLLYMDFFSLFPVSVVGRFHHKVWWSSEVSHGKNLYVAYMCVCVHKSCVTFCVYAFVLYRHIYCITQSGSYISIYVIHNEIYIAHGRFRQNNLRIKSLSPAYYCINTSNNTTQITFYYSAKHRTHESLSKLQYILKIL